MPYAVDVWSSKVDSLGVNGWAAQSWYVHAYFGLTVVALGVAVPDEPQADANRTNGITQLSRRMAHERTRVKLLEGA